MTLLFLDATLPAATTDDVNAERDRRLARGFMFNGKMYQSDPGSLLNFSGAATDANIAITVNGAQVGDYRWASPNYDFKWITTDNSEVLTDAPTMVLLGQAARDWVTRCTYAANDIKKRIRAGERITDITRASLWP